MAEHRIGRTIDEYAVYGRMRYRTGGVFTSASFPNRASRLWAFVGVPYAIKDRIVSELSVTAQIISGQRRNDLFAPLTCAASQGGGIGEGQKAFGALMVSAADHRPVVSETRPLISCSNILDRITVFSAQHYPVFTCEELTWFLERDFRAPQVLVREILDKMAEGENPRLTRIDQKYYALSSFDLGSHQEEVAKAIARDHASFVKFLRACGERAQALDKGDVIDVEGVWNAVMRTGYDKPSLMGIRGAYLYLVEDGLLRQVRRTSNRETSYLQAQSPEGVMASVLADRRTIIHVDIGNSSETGRRAFEEVGLSVDEDFISRCTACHVRSLTFIRLVNRTGEPVGILLLRDPVYFEASQQALVDTQFTLLASAIGRAVGGLQHRGVITTPPTVVVAKGAGGEETYNLERERNLWEKVHGEGGLEAKIAGKPTNDHRRDFVTAMVQHIREALTGGRRVVVQEDAAGAAPIIGLLLQGMMEKQEGGQVAAVLPEGVIRNFSGVVRDFSSAAVKQAKKLLADAGFHQVCLAEEGDMFVRSPREKKSVDFFVACMAFYCTREKFRAALREWKRLASPGAQGWFSMKAEDGDTDKVKKATIAAFISEIPLWQKVVVIPFVIRIALFIRQRQKSGAFWYGRELKQGFVLGRYYSPTEKQLEEDLTAVGLKMRGVQRSLANQFFLVNWENAE